MTKIRWKRRLRKWVGFVGTSRKPSAEIKRSGSVWCARSNWRGWLEAPSWQAAAEWCERQFAPQPRPKPIAVLVVEADGKTERRAMESLRPTLAMYALPRSWGGSSTAIETVIYKGNWWEMSYEEWRTGISGRFRVFVYAHPQATPEMVERAAFGEIRQRRIMLDKALYDLGGRFGGSRELQQVADQIFEGSI